MPNDDSENETAASQTDPELSRREATGLDVAMAVLTALIGGLVTAVLR